MIPVLTGAVGRGKVSLLGTCQQFNDGGCDGEANLPFEPKPLAVSIQLKKDIIPIRGEYEVGGTVLQAEGLGEGVRFQSIFR